MAENNAKGLILIIVIIFVVFFSLMLIDSGEDGQLLPENSTADTYILPFPEDLSPGLVSRDDLGISLVIAVDVSGSMSGVPASGGSEKYLQATSAMGQVMEVLSRLVNGGDKDQIIRLGLIRFDNEVEQVLEVTTLNTGNLTKIRRLATNPETWQPRGATAIGSALESGTAMLAGSGTILRSLILITDGENTQGVEPSWVLSAIFNNRNNKSTPDFPLFTSSYLMSVIGFDIDSEIFSPWREFGARVTSASNQEQLASTLSGLLEADITKLEAPAAF